MKSNVIKFPDFVQTDDYANWYNLQRQKKELLEQKKQIRKQRDGI